MASRDGIAPGGDGLPEFLGGPAGGPQSLATVGAFELVYGQEFGSFLCRIIDANGAEVDPTNVRVRIGVGRLDDAANLLSGVTPLPNLLQGTIDPRAFPVFDVETPVRRLWVYVLAATASTFIEIRGIRGSALLRPPSAAEIATAIAAATVTTAARAVTGASGVAVAMGAASAQIVAANPARERLILFNSGAVDVAVCFNAAPAVFATDIKLVPNEKFEDGDGRCIYRGEVRGITAGGAGEIRYVDQGP